MDSKKAFQPLLVLDITWRLWIPRVDTFYEMEEDPHNMVKNIFL